MRIQRWTKKMKNRAGASLIYAMLIMMVCTVIASVVLTAATAAAGRIVKTGETDQRYYAINSVVNMLKDALTDAEYSFKWTYQTSQDIESTIFVDYLKNTDYEETVKSSANISELLINQPGQAIKWTAARYGIRTLDDLSDIFMNASLDMLVGLDRVPLTDDTLVNAWRSYENPAEPEQTPEETPASDPYAVTENHLTVSLYGSDNSEKCSVQLITRLTEEGTLVVEVIGGASDSQGTGYSVTMNFRADIDDKSYVAERRDVIKDPGTPVTLQNGSVKTTRTISRITQKERDTVYRWKLDSIITHEVS